MSLDKQRILSELGSVMNQLQSADCGCMGKLFSNSNQGDQGGAMGSPLPTCGGCRRGWCHGHGYGHGAPAAGEPCSMNPSMSMNRPCMGHCNPSKLYGDTYGYLNSNLMQPVVQEVYNDLKSITPANTVMNSPLATNMGISQGQPGNASSPGMGMVQNNEPLGSNMGNQMQNSMPMGQTPSPANNMGGMGPQIMNMMMGENAKQGNTQKQYQSGQLTGPMVIDAPQSPHGQVGVTPLNQQQGTGQGKFNTNMNPNVNQGQYNAPNMSSFAQKPATQYMTQPNLYAGANSQNLSMEGQRNDQNLGNAKMGNKNAAPAVPQQRAAPNYGQHTQGMMKFNEMFPGVMQGDLGFDPMAIAIQMNPANQQKAAMDTMQKLMHGIPINSQKTVTQPPVNFTQPQNIQNAQALQNADAPQNAQAPQNVQQNIPPNQFVNQQMAPGQQQQATIVPQQQQVYTAVTGKPPSNQQQMQTYQQPPEPQQQYEQQQNQQFKESNKEGSMMSPVNGNQCLESANPPPQQMIREPIFPADTSKYRPSPHPKSQRQYEYNTLGQPIEMLPAHIYHPAEPSLPQTLSPQPIETKLRTDQMRYSNVKSTISKTSLMGNKPLGKMPSRSQLQHIYRQYKGSQSYTQQNVKPVGESTLSDGRLNVTPTNANPQKLHVPMERVGGDTIANNAVNDNRLTNKVEQIIGQVGDVPTANKPHGDMEPIKPSPAISARQAKCRNGLQDVVYTSYPTAAAWSFHGSHSHNSRAIPAGYNFRRI